eukprot:scaffold61598_cov63-Phaeocystis_antarctica.AAC.3
MRMQTRWESNTARDERSGAIVSSILNSLRESTLPAHIAYADAPSVDFRRLLLDARRSPNTSAPEGCPRHGCADCADARAPADERPGSQL